MLTARLEDGQEPVRTASAAALSEIGIAAVPALLRAVELKRGLARQAAAKALIPLTPSRRVAGSPLLQMMQDAEPASRRQAIETLGAIHAADERIIGAIISALGDTDPGVRVAAAKALGQLSWKAQPAVPALTLALRDESAALREASALSLGQIGSAAQPAMAELIRLAQDKNDAVRAAAAEAVPKIRPPMVPDKQ